MSQRYWEQKLEEYRNSHTQEVADLAYLNLEGAEKVTHKDLAHNLRINTYRQDLANKILVGLSHKHAADIIREIHEDNRKLQNNLKACEKALKEQQAELTAIKSSVPALREELRKIQQSWSEHRPLSKDDVEKLVLRISEQPKFIEQQTESLIRELTSKVSRVEHLIHQLEGRILG
nr:ORF1 [Pineapple bacilliform CO virus]